MHKAARCSVSAACCKEARSIVQAASYASDTSLTVSCCVCHDSRNQEVLPDAGVKRAE